MDAGFIANKLLLLLLLLRSVACYLNYPLLWEYNHVSNPDNNPHPQFTHFYPERK